MERNLAAFLAVAQHGSLTDASDALGVTQPSVTKRIANLEASYGTLLFERDRRGMRLTEAGKMLLENAERIALEYRLSREKIGAIASPGLSVLRVGAGPLFHLSCVASLFTQLKSRFPDLRLDLKTDMTQLAREALLSGEIDLYLGVINDEGVEAEIYSTTVTEVEHGVVMRPDHPAAGHTAIDISDLAGQQWIIFGNDPETETRLGSLLKPGAATQDVIDIRTTSFTTGLQLVREGPFIMSAPLQLAPRVAQEGLIIHPIKQGLPRREAGVHLRRSALDYGVMKACLAFFVNFEF
ncbi:MAG: LysR family transcriptional regulator [Pseudomonadota bacterium]